MSRQEIIHKYFDDDGFVLKRKTDGFVFRREELQFYTESELKDCGQGSFKKEFLTE